MSKTEKVVIPNMHEQADIFRESVNFTAGQSGFSAHLIEKDYFCTLLLSFFAQHSGSELIFKGGTSLAKVFFDFYRLSEDLDFIIPMPVGAKQKERSGRVANLKKAFAALPAQLPVFHLEEGLKGANSSRQYLATIGYKSFVDGRSETIKLEVGLREPLLRDSTKGMAKTLLQNATNSQTAVNPYELQCLSLVEAMAEKSRAALSRREVAIRDFYDLDYAALRKVVESDEPEFINMIRQKLAIPGNDPPNTSDERLAPLQAQLESRLKPVLRTQDYNDFDLDRALRLVKNLHKRLEETNLT